MITSLFHWHSRLRHHAKLRLHVTLGITVSSVLSYLACTYTELGAIAVFLGNSVNLLWLWEGSTQHE